MLNEKTTGKIGEKIAGWYLRLKGYQTIETNYHTRRGEIDLICKKGKEIIFVEVKTRSNQTGGYPEEAVTTLKLEKIKAAAFHYLLSHQIKLPPRIDVISIEFKKNHIPKICHYKNIYFD